MDNYEVLGKIGEGTYGVVLKARHKESGQIVAIKKIKESDSDEQVRKTALREVRILKQLKHDNIVGLIEVFRRKGKLHLVFEYVERTILEDLEANPDGLPESEVKWVLWQLVRSIEFCHSHNVIHRDIKPENLLMSKNGVLKLCDFGFARNLAGPGARYTDYVSTRWYRSPELLVGDQSYSKPVDVWAIGCMMAELCNGLPLFPGESDIDQLFHIVQCFGKLTDHMEELMRKNPLFVGVKIPEFAELETLDQKLRTVSAECLDFLHVALRYEPEARATCEELASHPFLDGCEAKFAAKLADAMEKDGNILAVKRKRRRDRRSYTKPASSFTATVPQSSVAAAAVGGAGFGITLPIAEDIESREARDKLMSVREALPGEDPGDPSRADLRSRQSHRGGEHRREREKEREREREARELEKERERERRREERKLDAATKAERDGDHGGQRGRRRDKRGAGSDRDKESEEDQNERRLLPNLQAQRLVDMATLMGDGEGDDDTRDFRRRVHDTIPQISYLGGTESKGRDSKPAAVMHMSGGMGPSILPNVKDLKIMGGAPASVVQRHGRHSSHGPSFGGSFAPRPLFQASGYTSKPPTHRTPYNPYGFKPPSRGMQSGGEVLGALQPPRTAHETSGGMSLRASGAPLGPIPPSSSLFSGHFAGTGVKLL